VPPERQAALYKALSPADPQLRTYIDSNSHFPAAPEVHVFGNVDVDEHGLRVSLAAPYKERQQGVPDGCGLYFHTDGSFFRTLPPVCTQLYCRVAPSPESSHGVLAFPSGDVAYDASATAFLDGRLAYDLCPPARRRQLDMLHVRYHPDASEPRIQRLGLRLASNGLRLVRPEDAEDTAGTGNDRFDPSTFPTSAETNRVRAHWPAGSEELYAHMEVDATGASCFPFVQIHPRTGRKAVVCSAVSVDTLSDTLSGEGPLGWLRSQEVIGETLEPALASAYFHSWRSGDLLLWDNRALLHSFTPAASFAGEDRFMHRISLVGTRDAVPRVRAARPTASGHGAKL
jgi:alpha-ketoglutarate-dependent taurine dioxygenase